MSLETRIDDDWKAALKSGDKARKDALSLLRAALKQKRVDDKVEMTDAVVVASAPRGNGPWLPYAGTHTEIGSMIGRVVADCLLQGLALAAQWAEKHRP